MGPVSKLGRQGGFVPPAFLVAALFLAVSLPASQAGDVSPAPGSKNDVYRRPLGNDPETLDPARISDIYSRSVAQQIFDGLVQFDQTLAIKPSLAEFWRASRDGLVWTFRLRKGVKFHHGRELTTDDVVFSLTRLLDPRVKSGAADLFLGIRGAREFRDGRASSVAGLAALDRYTLQVTLDDSQVPFVSLLAVGHAKIVPRDAVEQAGSAFGSRPLGTGPFRLVRWDRGKEVVLAGNPEYFEGPPRLRRLVYRVFPGENVDAMFEAFERGEIEDTPIPIRNYRAIVGGAKYHYVKRPMISVRFYGFNVRMKPFTDRRVRQAFVRAVDRDALHEEVFLGRYSVARGILPPGMLAYNAKLAGHPYDPARARVLLAEAGYPGGRGLGTIAIWSGARRDEVVREQEQMKRYLAAIGVNAEVHYQTDWPTFSKWLAEGKFPMFLYAWYADVPDPDNFLAKLFHSAGSRNLFGYANPGVDDVLNRARAEQDAQRRVELYRRAEELIVDDAPVIPTWHYTYERLFQPYVRSVEVNGLGDPYIPLRKIWLEGKR